MLAFKIAHHLLRVQLTTTTTSSSPFTLNAVDLNDHKARRVERFLDNKNKKYLFSFLVVSTLILELLLK